MGVVIQAPEARGRQEVRPSTVVRRGEGGVPVLVTQDGPPEDTRYAAKPLSLRRRPVVLALTLSGWTPKQIAAKLRCTAASVRQTQYALRQDAKLDDEIARVLDAKLVPRAVENLTTLLEAGDKDATFKTLEGRGVFRKDVKVEADTTMRAFHVHFEVPTAGPVPVVAAGAVVASPHSD